jgi:hypothetical protein
MFIKILGLIGESIGWCLKWFIPNRLKIKLYHKFDSFFDGIILREIYKGTSDKEELIRVTRLESFIINDSILRLTKNGLIEFKDGK